MGSAVAQESRTLVIGTKEAAPFSFRVDGGPWQGISIDLWNGIAEDLGLEYELREVSLEELIEGLRAGRLDASVAALTVTSQREEVVDFTHSLHPSGLGIAVPPNSSSALTDVARRLISVRFFQATGTLVVILFLGGALLWLFERRRNPEQFGGTVPEGLGAAFWWSAVTMTTVGYGDKAPVSIGGRLVAVVWMFASVIVISGLTATIASALTVSHLESSIAGPKDLAAAGLLGCVRGSTGEAYLQEERLTYTSFETVLESMEALAEERVRAVVYDAPILRYLARGTFAGRVNVLPVTFERQDYAFALPLESPLRKRINQSLLEHVKSEEWSYVIRRYLGESE